MNLDWYRSAALKALMGTAVTLNPLGGPIDGIPIIDDNTTPDILFPTGAGFGHDPSQYVPDMFASPDQLKLIPDSEYDARFDEQNATESSLEHVYLRKWVGPCLDQNGQGYCWDYSTTGANMLWRLARNFPFVRLCGHAAASIIKNGKDEGGWCGLSYQFQSENGQAPEGNGPLEWPEHGFGKSLNARFQEAAFKTNMARFKITDGIYDLGKPAYSQQLKQSQLVTCLFNNNPSPVDFNFWSHSVCGVRWVRISANEWGLLILNSWKGWGNRGLAVLRGVKARPDGAVCVISSQPA